MNAAPAGAKRPDLASLLPSSPDAYPQALDLVRGLVLVIRMDAGAYRSASFLDDRILGPSTEGAWLSGAAVTQAARQAANARPLHYIFHSGHVGSTLLSRVLDETGGVLGLREPLPLRTLADAHDVLARPESLLAEPQFAGLAGTFHRLWSRGYESTRAVVVKATSSTGRIAPSLLSVSPSTRAVYLNLAAEPYVATLLGGAHSSTDLRGHGPGRMRRLLAGRELPVAPLHALSIGELAALGWLVESLSQAAAQAAGGARVLALDFGDFLADPPGATARVTEHFGLPRDEAFLAALDESPVLRQYSKSPGLPFPPGEREARLAASRRDNQAEIARALAWLERLAHADSTIGALPGGAA